MRKAMSLQKTTVFPKNRLRVARRIFSIFGFFVVLSTASTALAQSNWYATGFLQYSQGDYIFGSKTATFYLMPGLRYEARDWNISAALPVVSQNNNLVTQAGGILVPRGGLSMNMSSGTGGMMGSSGNPSMRSCEKIRR